MKLKVDKNLNDTGSKCHGCNSCGFLSPGPTALSTMSGILTWTAWIIETYFISTHIPSAVSKNADPQLAEARTEFRYSQDSSALVALVFIELSISTTHGVVLSCTAELIVPYVLSKVTAFILENEKGEVNKAFSLFCLVVFSNLILGSSLLSLGCDSLTALLAMEAKELPDCLNFASSASFGTSLHWS
jgi:hypothetical protein